MLDSIIGLDIGTTNAKALIYDLAGVELARSEAAYPINAPHPGWAEQNPAEVWRATLLALKSAIDNAGQNLHTLALAVASQSGSLVPADDSGAPLYPSITWMDGRTEALLKEWLTQHISARVRAISGWNIHAGLPLATIAWLQRHMPELYCSVRRWLCMNDYIVHRLTGRFVTNPSNGSVMQMMELAAAGWSAELLELVGARPDQFSPVQPSGTVVGQVTEEVARAAGLSLDTQVVNGGHDQSCTALALGVLEPRQALLACGTSWVVTAISDHPDIAALQPELDMNFHVVPQRLTVSQSLGVLGASMEWLIRECWREIPDRQQRYAAMDGEVAHTAQDHAGLVFIPAAGGHTAPAGMQRGGFINLNLGHTRAHLARAVMESAASELSLALQHMQTDALRTTTLWMVGGATRSSHWPAIVADAVGHPLRVTQSSHLPAVGAAILAGLGAGVYRDVHTALRSFRQPEQTYTPDSARMRVYADRLPEYVRLTSLFG